MIALLPMALCVRPAEKQSGDNLMFTGKGEENPLAVPAEYFSVLVGINAQVGVVDISQTVGDFSYSDC